MEFKDIEATLNRVQPIVKVEFIPASVNSNRIVSGNVQDQGTPALKEEKTDISKLINNLKIEHQVIALGLMKLGDNTSVINECTVTNTFNSLAQTVERIAATEKMRR